MGFLSLLSAAVIDPTAIANICDTNIIWDDLSLDKKISSPQQVEHMLQTKFPQHSKLVLEKKTHTRTSGGATWHREDTQRPGDIGLRGTLFFEVNGQNKISYVCEGCEPIFKPGKAIEALLKAATSQTEINPSKPSFVKRDPIGARDTVEYLWKEAYPGGAPPSEALRLFSEEILYEDFNYECPFMGIDEVTRFVNNFNIPGVEFVIDRVSDGDSECAFTWIVRLNNQDGPRGISFYGMDEKSGKINYIRDIPAPSIKPPPLGSLAAMANPRLRTFRARSK